MFMALGCLVVPGSALAQPTASEVAAFYETFLVQPPRPCAELRAWTGPRPLVASGLCKDDAATDADLHKHLADHIRDNPPETKALINGGGVSMGSYQAGRLQGVINDARIDALEQLFDAAVLATDPAALARVDARLNALLVGTPWANLGFEQVAGASAGGMNAAGFAIELCRSTLLPTFVPGTAGSAVLDSSDSVLRRLWMDVGFDKSEASSWAGGASLLREEDPSANATNADPNAVFSVTPLDNVIQTITAFFGAEPPVALRPGCGMGVSITVTSLRPVEVPLKGSEGGSFLTVTLPVMVDLRVVQAPRPHFMVQAYPSAESVMTVRTGSTSEFLLLVRATGALPPALPMLMLREIDGPGPIRFKGRSYEVGKADAGPPLKESQSGTEADAQALKEARELNLVDGGLFNNNPLDLVLDRVPEGAIQNFLFFDQDFTRIPRPTARAKYKGNTLYVHFQRLLSAAIVDVARNQQVASALRRFKPGKGPSRVEPLGRLSPVLSEAGFATSAFLLRDFRELDYLAGILDAHVPAGTPPDFDVPLTVRNKDLPARYRTWVATHSDIELLLSFYGSPLASELDDPALLERVDRCHTRPSSLTPGQPWGRRCLLAAAARRAVQRIKRECKPTTREECEKASLFSALGKAAQELEAEALKREGQEPWRYVDSVRGDIEARLSLLGDRIDETVRNQPSFFALPSRALDIGLEALFIDGLQFLPGSLGGEKERRVLRGRRNRLRWTPLTDVRLVLDQSFWMLEGSHRTPPWVAFAWKAGSVEFGVGWVPALSFGLGGGCSNSGTYVLVRCLPNPTQLPDGGFQNRTPFGGLVSSLDVSAELVAVNFSLVSVHLGGLVTARGGFTPGGGTAWGVGLETGGFLRVGVARTLSADLRLVTGLNARTGADIAKPAGSADLYAALGWQY